MHRREILAAAALATAGCIGGGEAGEQTPEPTQTRGPENAEYLGVHDDHGGPPVENVDYEIHSGCQATIFVWFEEPPDYDHYLAVWFYKDGHLVNQDRVGMSPSDVERGRQKFPFKYCGVEEFDAFEVGVETR